jgi:hypothetical protein
VKRVLLIGRNENAIERMITQMGSLRVIFESTIDEEQARDIMKTRQFDFVVLTGGIEPAVKVALKDTAKVHLPNAKVLETLGADMLVRRLEQEGVKRA